MHARVGRSDLQLGFELNITLRYDTGTIRVEFKAVIVLPQITQNYLYGNYVGNAPVGKVITLNT